jgi:hypothetical protein
MRNTEQETMMDFEGQFVYCRTSSVVYKRRTHSEKGPSKLKAKANEIKGNLFANL